MFEQEIKQLKKINIPPKEGQPQWDYCPYMKDDSVRTIPVVAHRLVYYYLGVA